MLEMKRTLFIGSADTEVRSQILISGCLYQAIGCLSLCRLYIFQVDQLKRHCALGSEIHQQRTDSRVTLDTNRLAHNLQKNVQN